MTPRLSIVHLTTFLQGGAGRAITDLACAQHADGHRVVVVSSATDVAGYGNYPHYLHRLREAGVPLLLVDSLFTRGRALNLVVLDRLKAVAPPGTVDIVHAHAGTPARIGMLYARGAGDRTRVIQTQHGWGSNKTPQQAQHDLDVLDELDAVVTTSDATRALLVDLGLESTRAVTIPCGITDRMAAPAPAEAHAALARFRARGDHVIGCVGTVNANKNQRLLLEALARLPERHVACVFVGEGGEALLAQTRELGIANRVIAVGYQPDAERWISAFDLLAVPSFTEGQGLVVLEAFRAGVPVLASDIASLRQLVEERETGWLFDPHDAATLARAIAVALDASADHRIRMTQRARRVFLECYTTERMVASHDRLYRDVQRSVARAL